MHALDDPIRSALTSRHASMATTRGTALRYPADVAPFGSLPMYPTADDWADLARLTPADDPAAMFVPQHFTVPTDWTTRLSIGLSQLIDDDVDTSQPRDADIVELGTDHVDEMLDLTALTRPGPFLRRTVVLGGYVGIRQGEQLVAMAGRRLSMPGWVEISAVCTHPEERGRGYARRLLTHVVRDIRADGDRAFLHVAHGNPARNVYEAMGFIARRDDLKVIDAAPPEDSHGPGML